MNARALRTLRHAPIPSDSTARLAPLDRESDAGPPPDPRSPFHERSAARRRSEARDLGNTRRLRLSALRAWLVVAAMIAAAVYAGLHLTDGRLEGGRELHLGTATVAATSMGVTAPADGHVAQVLTRPLDSVDRGAPVARVRLFEPGGALAEEDVALVRTPIDGVLAGVMVREGGAVRRGSPIVEVYDPRSTVFEVPVDAEILGRLSRGMRVTLTSSAVDGELTAVVDGVRPAPPRPNAVDSTTVVRPTLLLRPGVASQARPLIPGVQLEATVDLGSVPDGAPRLLEVES